MSDIINKMNEQYDTAKKKTDFTQMAAEADYKLKQFDLLASKAKEDQTIRIIALQCATNGAFAYTDAKSFDDLLKHFEHYVKYGLGEIPTQTPR